MTDAHDPSSRLSRIRVRDCMHHGLLSCGPDDPLVDVAATMANHRVHAVLISDRVGGRPLGVVSDLDVLAAVARGEDRRTARDAAGREPLTISSDAPVQEAARLMSERAVSHLVVVDSASGYPAGVISTLDVASIYSSG
jgi:CBS domain-containing protein